MWKTIKPWVFYNGSFPGKGLAATELVLTTYSSTEVENGYSWVQLYLYLLSVPTLAFYGVIFTFT